MDRLNEKQIQILRQKLCDMHSRCENKSNPSYVDYGGRGIKVCEEWSGKDKHNIFRKWSVDNGWCEFLSIDRIDVNGDYSPLNCRWANPREQANNRRNNNYIEINGVTKTASEWASEVGISFQAFKCRIKYGKVGLELLEKPKTPLKLSKSEMSKEIRKWRNLEESGLLIKLPYPVGTPLFIPCRKQGVKQDHIRRWQTNNKGLMFCSNGSFYLADAIGKSVFLTREEADNKLKEME